MDGFKNDVRFRPSERNALIALIILTLCSYAYTFLVKPKLPHQTNIKTIDELLIYEPNKDTIKAQVISYTQKEKKNYKPRKKAPPIELKNFNPNESDSLTLLKLGLKTWTVSNIMKYRAKGGRFYKCEDLQRIYSLEEDTYRSILPYCNIPKQNDWSEKKGNNYPSEYKKKQNWKKDNWKKDSSKVYQAYTKPKKYTEPVDINTADTTALKTLVGIGSSFSKRIVKYRNSLGGFHSISQLAEVYGLEPEVLEKNKARLALSPQIRPINVNAEKDSLAAHPYISWTLAKVLVNYRKQHGTFNSPEDILKTRVVSDSLFQKLEPYLTSKG